MVDYRIPGYGAQHEWDYPPADVDPYMDVPVPGNLYTDSDPDPLTPPAPPAPSGLSTRARVGQTASGLFTGPNSFGSMMYETAKQLPGTIARAIDFPAASLRGEVDPLSDEGIGRAADAAGTVTLGGGAVPRAAPRNSLRAGYARPTNPDMEHVTSAAIYGPDGNIYAGRMHYEIGETLPPDVADKFWSDYNPAREGFLTSTGRFVTREEADDIARASGQIDDTLTGQRSLSSEDLMAHNWGTDEDDMLSANRDRTAGAVPLAMDRESRMRRAAEMGFNTETYHGSTIPDVREFLPDTHSGTPRAAEDRLRSQEVQDRAMFDPRNQPPEMDQLEVEPLGEITKTDGGWERVVPRWRVTFPDGSEMILDRYVSSDKPVDIQIKEMALRQWSENKKAQTVPSYHEEYGRGESVYPLRLRGKYFQIEDLDDGLGGWNLLDTPINKMDPEDLQYGFPGLEIKRGERKKTPRQIMQSRGYAGVQYINGIEDVGSTSYLTFDPKDIRSTAAAFDPAKSDSADILAANRSVAAGAVPIFSRMEREAQRLTQPRATGEQWSATLKNRGVPNEEIEWTGVADWLKSRGTLPVTKEELMREIETRRTNVGVSRKDTTTMYSDYNDAVRGSTRYQQYQLPGGENYREVLLTLPRKPATEDQVKAGAARTDRQGNLVIGDEFTSSHWDEPNVLAHMRVNDRFLPDPVEPAGYTVRNLNSGNIGPRFKTRDEAVRYWENLPEKMRGQTRPEVIPARQPTTGTRVLFAEEIQSDWHQKGRREGYKINVTPEAIDQKARELVKESGVNWENLPEYSREIIRGTAEQNLRSGTTPNAPFKKTWPDLVLRRLVADAIEGGYDAIAWTDGATQAARYDLSKQVDAVRAFPQKDGSFDLWAMTPGAHAATELQKGVRPEKLPEYVGKDLADKIIAANGGEYSGLDLQVGGEGMRAFYDQELPRRAKKLFGRYGAVVEDSQIPGKSEGQAPQIHLLRITPEMRTAIQSEGLPLFANRSKEIGMVAMFEKPVPPEDFFIQKKMAMADGSTQWELHGPQGVQMFVNAQTEKEARKLASERSTRIQIPSDRVQQHKELQSAVIRDKDLPPVEITDDFLTDKGFNRIQQLAKIQMNRGLTEREQWELNNLRLLPIPEELQPRYRAFVTDPYGFVTELTSPPLHRASTPQEALSITNKAAKKWGIRPSVVDILPATPVDEVPTSSLFLKTKGVPPEDPILHHVGPGNPNPRIDYDQLQTGSKVILRKTKDAPAEAVEIFKIQEDGLILARSLADGDWREFDPDHIRSVISYKNESPKTGGRFASGGAVSVTVNGQTYTGAKKSLRGRPLSKNIDDRRGSQWAKVDRTRKGDRLPSALESLVAPESIGMTHPHPEPDGDEMRTDATITEGIPPTIEELILRQGGDQFTSGLVKDPTPGRTDRLPTSMPADSYVIPADIVSGMGQGNTLAGAKILDAIFRAHGGATPHRAEGGATPAAARVPVIVAGGEYIVPPDRVRSVGGGDAAEGHKLLDSFTRRHRVNLVRRLKTLPGPRKD